MPQDPLKREGRCDSYRRSRRGTLCSDMSRHSPTAASIKVLQIFLDEPTGDHYGYDLMRATHLKSGSLYPILKRLLRDGYLTVHDEPIDPRIAGRPARRVYRLTSDGAERARHDMKEFYRHLPVPAWVPRVGMTGP